MEIYKSKITGTFLELIYKKNSFGKFYELDDNLKRIPLTFYRGDVKTFKKKYVRNHNFEEIKWKKENNRHHSCCLTAAQKR